jgi:ABC-type branched-subunit amino acid transport system substrate-binding protein
MAERFSKIIPFYKRGNIIWALIITLIVTGCAGIIPVVEREREFRILTLTGDDFMEQERPFDAVTNYLKAIKKRPRTIPADDIKKKIEDIIHERLSIDQLEKMRRSYWYGYPSGHILYKDLKRARSYINKFIFYNRRHPYFEKAIRLRERLKELEFVDHNAIGCILPLTGRYAPYGSRALEAIILATGIFDHDKESPLKLFIEDSKSDPATARDAVVKLTRQDRVIGILGPLGEAAALEAATEAQRLNIPILTLSRNREIAGIGDYVFQDFMTDLMQVRTLVKYSIQNLGMTRFAILYPKNDRGIEMMNLFRDEALRWGGEIRAVESYQDKQTDFGKEIKSLTGLCFMEKENPGPVIDFDALFIPDSHFTVRMIAPQLAFYGVTGIQLLGTSSWNSPDLFKEEGKYLEGAVFVDGFFRDSFYPSVRDFIDNFYVACGREPACLEALAYDAAGIMVSAIHKSDVEIREDLKDGLFKLKDYPGIAGKTSFSETGEAKRSLFVLMAEEGKIVQIN